jgi:hypothetical protein
MIRADYRLNDPLFGAVSRIRGNGVNARIYFTLDKVRRSRLVANRLFWLVVNAYGVVIVASMIARWTIRTIMGAYPTAETYLLEMVTLVVLFLVLVTCCWFALKSTSWIRWMVRQWNVDQTALRGRTRAWRSGAHTSRRTTTHSSSPTGQRPRRRPRFRFANLVEIGVVWFLSEIIRKMVKADWRAGDRTVGVASSVPNSTLMIRWYPEEYLTGDKFGRAIMIVSTLVPMAVALQIIVLTRPSRIVGDLDAANSHLLVIILIIAWRVLLDSQSFLRWMLRNWNTPVDDDA